MSGPLSHPPGKDKGTIRRGVAGAWGGNRVIATANREQEARSTPNRQALETLGGGLATKREEKGQR